VKLRYVILIIGVVIFITGMMLNYLINSIQNVDPILFLTIFGLAPSGLIIVGVVIVYMQFSRKR
jgi:hypothetical protein